MVRSGAGDSVRQAETPAVVRALAAFGLANSTLQLPTSPLPEGAWSELLDAGSSERLLGLLFAATETGAFPVTPMQADQVRQLATESTRYCVMLEAELVRVALLLDTAGASLRVLKGPATAALDYPDPTWRPFIDIDLLVRSEEFDAAVATLVAAGHARQFPEPRRGFDRRFSKGTSFVAPSGLALDLHRTFVMGPYGLTLRVEDLWGPGTPFSVGRRTFTALPAEARLLHACYHAALGDWPLRLLPHRDIAQMLLTAPCDEDGVLTLARRWHAEAVLATSLANTWDLLGIAQETKLSTWARCFVPTADDRRALGLYARPESNYAAMSIGALRVIPGLRNKAAFLRALVFPDRNYVIDRHSTRRARVARGVHQVLDVRRSRA